MIDNFQLYQALGCGLEAWNLEKTTTTTTTSTTTPTPSIPNPNYPCVLDDPLNQYCHTLPESYAENDPYDNNESSYHVDKDFNAGNTIRFSNVCSGDWYMPGSDRIRPDGSYWYHCNMDPSEFPTVYCQWLENVALEFAVPSPNGYVTPRNCPVCGCTPGKNDVEKFS